MEIKKEPNNFVSYLILVLYICSLWVTACRANIRMDSPDEAARSYMDSMYLWDFPMLQKLACEAKKEENRPPRTEDLGAPPEALTLSRQLMRFYVEEPKTSGLIYKIIQQDEGFAVVHIEGEMYLVGGEARVVHMDDQVQMVREGGEWHWCGYISQNWGSSENE